MNHPYFAARGLGLDSPVQLMIDDGSALGADLLEHLRGELHLTDEGRSCGFRGWTHRRAFARVLRRLLPDAGISELEETTDGIYYRCAIKPGELRLMQLRVWRRGDTFGEGVEAYPCLLRFRDRAPATRVIH